MNCVKAGEAVFMCLSGPLDDQRQDCYVKIRMSQAVCRSGRMEDDVFG